MSIPDLKVRENLRKFSGRVFHVVQDGNFLRYRITDQGNLVRDKMRREMRKRVTGDPEKKIREYMTEVPQVGYLIVKRQMRKQVTGDPEKKIRDYMNEVPQVKFIDKLYFTFGVGCVVLTEYLALRHPYLFTQYYYLLLSLLVTIRFFQYKEENQELFMLDFCYFANLSTMIQTALYPDCLIWYKANYVICMGCLMLAIVVWQNSLVFHSLDKITSFLLHAFPPLTLHMYRWHLIPDSPVPEDDTLSWSEAYFWPMLLYVFWQVSYLFVYEVLLAETLRNDPEKISSVRWLVKDKKNGMHQLVVSICRKHGWMKSDEELNGDTWKAKVVFMIAQLCFTIFTILVVPFLYKNYVLSVIYIATIYMWCVWRGGTYYIEVFSERYKLKFVKLQDDPKEKKVLEEAHEDEHEHDEVFEDAELYSQIFNAISKEHDDRLESSSDDGKLESNTPESEERKTSSENSSDTEPPSHAMTRSESSEVSSEQKVDLNISGAKKELLSEIVSGIQTGDLTLDSVNIQKTSTKIQESEITSITSKSDITSVLSKSSSASSNITSDISSSEVLEAEAEIPVEVKTDPSSDSSESSYVEIKNQEVADVPPEDSEC